MIVQDMPRKTKLTSSTNNQHKSDRKLAAAVTELEQRFVLLDADLKKLQKRMATFKKQAIAERDRETEARLRAKLGQR